MAEDGVATGAVRRERLAQRRKALGLTQEALASLLDVKRSTVARWERGETEPLPGVRPKLAAALQISAERLEKLLEAAQPDRTRPPAAGRGDGVATAGPRQLPATIADFTGRAAELAALTRILDETAGTGASGTVVISAIGGTAGVGKTALALHWAHRVAGRFGDGELYVNLRGFDPAGTPANPAEAIHGFLDALGVPPERIPPTADAQAALYRGMLADRKMLIVLDNARDERQVRPLLPASVGTLVVVTSRNQLTGLAATDGARLLSVDVLSQGEAVQLLTARVGRARSAAEPDAIAEIATLCACLPLAVAVAAARAAARPGFPLAALATELRDAAGRLDALDAGDPVASIQAVFSWSYQRLSDRSARMFRLLGLHPGPDIGVHAAASLAGTSEPEARRLLRDLARDCLVTEHAPGRYTFHDLLRAYAAIQAREGESEPERAAGTGRVLDHYLHTACAAAIVLQPSHEPIALAAPRPGVNPEHITDYEHAMAWFRAEHHVLLSAVASAAESGFDVHAWQIPWALMHFLARQGQYREWVTIERTALAAARRLGDVGGQAVSGRLLADAYNTIGDYDRVPETYQDSLALYRQLGDRHGEAKVYQGLCFLAQAEGRYADAVGDGEQALNLFRAIDHKAGQVEMLNNVAWCYTLLEDYQRARELCGQALALNAEVGHRSMEAGIWDSLGYAEHHLGNLDEAISCYERAAAVLRELGYRRLVALTRSHAGDTHRAAGQSAQARAAWDEALVILDDLGHADAGEIRAKLAELDDQDAGHRHG